MSRSSVIHMLLILAGLVCYYRPTAQAQVNPAQQFEVTVKPVKSEILIAEPLRLEVTVRNATSGVIKALELFVDRAEPEIEVYISPDGKKFQQYAMGIYPSAKSFTSGTSWACTRSKRAPCGLR